MIETVAASQTSQVLGGDGAKGDTLHALIIVPANASPGAVTLQDGSKAAMTLLAGGASSLTDVVPIHVPIEQRSENGPWKVTTGADVSVVAIGSFT